MISCTAIHDEFETRFFLEPVHRSWLTDLLGDRVQFDAPMQRYTTLGVGGPADALVTPSDLETLKTLVSGLHRRSIPWMVVGGGSNLLVRDGGIRGIVIVLGAYYKGIDEVSSGDTPAELSVRAGTRLATLCRYAIDHGMAGLAFAQGIPGSVGGAIAMNAGTSAGSIEDVLTSIAVLWPTGQVQRIDKKELAFDYRQLTLPVSDVSGMSSGSSDAPCGVIIDGNFRLEPADTRQLSLDAQKIVAERRQRQPLGIASAGCFFKNPSVGLSAGQLIDMAGLKGKRVGGAQVSMLHANFIINRGQASAADILGLAELVETRVAAQFGIQLEPEVIIVGESNYASKSV